ncbi:MAG: hypothetical protein K1X39_06420 [Thermoflexales bacterium]|nr:hypothetical protein [Thermoflexales bacterium]
MDLHDLLQIVRRRWWIVALTALVAGVAAFALSKATTPEYKATMQFVVQPSRADYGLTQSTRQLTASYIAVIWKRKSADIIRERLNLDYPAEYIYGQTKVADDAANNSVTIEVRDYDGETAKRIALEWARLFFEYRESENAKQRQEDRVKVVLGDDPTYSLDKPRTTTNTAAGIVLGAMLGLLIVAALEWTQSTIVRTRAELERALSLPVLAVVPPEK